MFNMALHLAQRHFNPAFYTGVTVTDTQLTVMLWNLSGQAVGYQVYSPLNPKKAGNLEEAKYFTHATKGKDAVWGLETVGWSSPFVFITEGILDAARLHSIGLPAVAVLGNNPKSMSGWIMELPHKTVAAVQGDKAGLMLALNTDRAVFLPEGEDVGSLPEEKFMDLFGKFMEPGLIV